MLDIDMGLPKAPDEDKYRFWDDGSLNRTGMFYTRLARNTVIYGNFNKAWKSLKGDKQYNRKRIRTNQFFKKQLKAWTLFFLEKLGVNKDNFIARSEEYLNILMEKTKECSADSPVLPNLVDSVNSTLDMIGGDWLEMSKRSGQPEHPVGGFFTPVQQGLPKAKAQLQQIEEATVEEDNNDNEEQE